ncbi:septal ring lytic transglycosylase RlpA family protein [Acuticoccus yangtzensis]|uniref:septal ring lytic transglycosylase RlpA family protein n=1 Tax=Acuticoccus yangtzensis TaxID=1443441 RepID=UPI0009F7B7C3|nr:septal ring lytic transglycosylase RlpA family protein [Acuticoccus yangtzensis]ORE94551.1 rare lipoprotein A [Stappia sp. 22II-S9-Z10]
MLHARSALATAVAALFIATSLPLAAPADAGTVKNGVASYYGKRFHGRRTANGERFNMNALTAAHRTLPFGTRVKVTNPKNGRSVTVRINDRGPYHGKRSIDLSRAAAEKIGMVNAGVASVKMEIF